MFKSRCFRLVLLALTLCALGAGVTCYYTARAASLLDRGRQALLAGEAGQARQLAGQLGLAGYEDHMHLLQGEILLAEGKAALRQAGPLFPYEEVQRIAQTVLAGPLLLTTPAGLCEAAWASASLVQKRFAADPPGRQELRLALGEFAQVQDEGPVGVEAALGGAECLVLLEERRVAAEALAALAKQHPYHKEIRRWQAAIYIDLNSPSEADAALRAWARLDPEDGRPCRWVGFFAKEYGKPAEAAEAYREALRRHLAPAVRAEVVAELAASLIESQGRYAEALALLDDEAAVRVPPAERQTLRAHCHWGLGRPAEAVAALEQALRANAAYVPALWLRAKIYLAEGRPAEAQPFLKDSVLLAPYDLTGHKLLLDAYSQGGDKAGADEQKRILVRLQADRERLSELQTQALGRVWDAEVRVRIARLYLRTGRPDAARMWLKAALACQPRHADARQLLDQLGGG
jgi:tetratricopeptide (TPR) repeat protein